MKRSKILEEITKISMENPNDFDLGSKVRSYINNINKNKTEDSNQLLYFKDEGSYVDVEDDDIIDIEEISKNLNIG